jgi:hypothetical protein
MLKRTGVHLELIHDIDMFQFVEKGMRGGAHRYSKANNKYMSDYKPDEASKYIMYLDANNLYGWAVIQDLPTGGFKWLKINGETDLAKNGENKKNGLILEVDLEYPEKLHDRHNGYPLAPESARINEEMLSEYCREIREKYNISVGGVGKLVTTLNGKEKYVVHSRNLQLYIKLGLKVKKIHRAMQFNQLPWLAEYIGFNIKMRTVAKNDFEKNFFKLMNNSVFGKTMENPRKRLDVRLVSDEDKLKKLTSSPTFTSLKIFNEDLVAVKKILILNKQVLIPNKPAHVGMCILELSKTLMYDFHYNYIKKKYGDKSKLLFTDTDGLMYEIKADDVYEDFFKDKKMFDNSDY